MPVQDNLFQCSEQTCNRRPPASLDIRVEIRLRMETDSTDWNHPGTESNLSSFCFVMDKCCTDFSARGPVFDPTSCSSAGSLVSRIARNSRQNLPISISHFREKTSTSLVLESELLKLFLRHVRVTRIESFIDDMTTALPGMILKSLRTASGRRDR